jgi:glycosyltransferase involved in cell wall biosynthesis
MVANGVTGLLFDPGNSNDLAAALTWSLTHPVELEHMGKRARQEFEEKYTPARNYQTLMEIYRGVLN